MNYTIVYPKKFYYIINLNYRRTTITCPVDVIYNSPVDIPPAIAAALSANVGSGTNDPNGLVWNLIRSPFIVVVIPASRVPIVKLAEAPSVADAERITLPPADMDTPPDPSLKSEIEIFVSSLADVSSRFELLASQSVDTIN